MRLRFQQDRLFLAYFVLLGCHNRVCQKSWLDAAASAVGISRYSRFADVLNYHLAQNEYPVR